MEPTMSPLLWQRQRDSNILGPKSVMATCRSCITRHQTKVKYKHTKKTHLMALGICLLSGIFSFSIPYYLNLEAGTITHLLALIIYIIGAFCSCCIPYYLNSSESVTHYCPACGAFIGTYIN
ncbi:uncharacterized protein LOC117783180 [Drosophila innubila]|uniref:uncharacterized protein LOC117783180 n=1 Tax=Drosophila innubila TaxID=198719 RepID=UPI00148DCDB9|nr:uncharacterized protein LOC117783180 [Drosophila innubila]